MDTEGNIQDLWCINCRVNNYQIESKEKEGNRGRIILNRRDLKRFRDAKTTENETIPREKSSESMEEYVGKMMMTTKPESEDRHRVLSVDSLESKTCVELKQLLRECSLKVSGQKEKLIQRLRHYHQNEVGTIT